MHPFFMLGNCAVPAYTLFAALGSIGALTLFFILLPKEKRKATVPFVLFTALGALLGAKGLYLLTVPWPGWSMEMLLYGFVFYGGVIGGLLAGGIHAALCKTNFLLLTDTAAPALALGHGIGRIGCFLAGCCYGRLFGTWRFPVQLTEAAVEGILCAFLLRDRKKDSVEGRSSGWYLMLYGLARFLLEFLRGDAVRGKEGGLYTSQWISLFAMALGIGLLLRYLHLEIKIRDLQLEARLFVTRVCVMKVRLKAVHRNGQLKLILEAFGREKPLQIGKKKRLKVDIKRERRQLLSLLRVKLLMLRVHLGVEGDAALTARLCGALQGLLSAAGSALFLREGGKTCIELAAKPDFQRDRLHLEARCIIRVRTGKLMRVLFGILVQYGKGAYHLWRTRSKTSCAPPWKT